MQLFIVQLLLLLKKALVLTLLTIYVLESFSLERRCKSWLTKVQPVNKPLWTKMQFYN